MRTILVFETNWRHLEYPGGSMPILDYVFNVYESMYQGPNQINVLISSVTVSGIQPKVGERMFKGFQIVKYVDYERAI